MFSVGVADGEVSENYATIEKEDGIEKVFIKNETEFVFDASLYTSGVEVFDYEKSPEEFKTEENGVLYHLYFDEQEHVYKINTVISDVCTGNKSVAENFAVTVLSLFDEARYKMYGITAEKTEFILSPVSVNVTGSAEYFETQENNGTMSVFAVQYIFAVVVLILIIYSSTYIIRAVLEEKASKLVEMLMVSVKPLALIMGKILAVMTYIFGLLSIVAISTFLSAKISPKIMGSPVSFEAIGFDLSGIRFDLPTFILIIVSLIISYLTYSIMAGIAGASCSNMEDIESANSTVMFTVLAGYMISVITCSIPSKILAVFTSLCPIVSTFSAPVHYVLGNIGFGVLVISYALQIIIVVLLAIFCSRIYSELIIRNGSKVRLRELFKIYFRKQI